MAEIDEYPLHERPVKAWCDPDTLFVELGEGRRIGTPIWWYPPLLEATPAQRATVELMLDGIHWPDLDLDLSVRGMLGGHKMRNAVEPTVEKVSASQAA